MWESRRRFLSGNRTVSGVVLIIVINIFSFRTLHRINTGLDEIEEATPEQRRVSERTCVLNHQKAKATVNTKLSKQRGSLFLQSGAGVSVPVNPVIAVAVGARDGDASAEAAEGEDEEDEAQNDEEEEVQAEEKPKPICMDFKTYVSCFNEAAKKTFGDRYDEELPKIYKLRNYVMAYGRDLTSQNVFWEALKRSPSASPQTLKQCEGLLRWQFSYTHIRNQEICSSFFNNLLAHPVDIQQICIPFRLVSRVPESKQWLA